MMAGELMSGCLWPAVRVCKRLISAAGDSGTYEQQAGGQNQGNTGHVYGDIGRIVVVRSILCDTLTSIGSSLSGRQLTKQSCFSRSRDILKVVILCANV
jgi:hypothetical protein